jgi:hypothetical protein
MTKKISDGEKYYTEYMIPWPSAFPWKKLDKDVQKYWERHAVVHQERLAKKSLEGKKDET